MALEERKKKKNKRKSQKNDISYEGNDIPDRLLLHVRGCMIRMPYICISVCVFQLIRAIQKYKYDALLLSLPIHYFIVILHRRILFLFCILLPVYLCT